jgi:hypothetical protein
MEMLSMSRTFRASSLLFAVIWLALLEQPVMAQMPTPQEPVGIQIIYKEPANSAHRPIYDRLKQRQILEQYKEFMSPLQLKRPLTVSLEGCNGQVNAWYASANLKITYCYELIADIEQVVAKTDVLPGFRREDALVGGFVQILLHETSHAVFHILDIPIFGREEDAADALAEFSLLQFGKNAARRTLTGTAFIWRAFELEGKTRTFEDFADEHGTNAQRFYNALCIAYGSDQVEGTHTFDDFVERKLLPAGRQAKCAQEYHHAKNSFAKLILPHVDQELMRKVQATDWLRSEDGTEILPPELTGGAAGGTGPLGTGPGTSPK